MKTDELNKLLKPFGKSIDDLTDKDGWMTDYSEFKTKAIGYEVCPECGREIEIELDGNSDCYMCGQEKVLPCQSCPLAELSICDWTKDMGCSPFPNNEMS